MIYHLIYIFCVYLSVAWQKIVKQTLKPQWYHCRRKHQCSKGQKICHGFNVHRSGLVGFCGCIRRIHIRHKNQLQSQPRSRILGKQKIQTNQRLAPKGIWLVILFCSCGFCIGKTKNKYRTWLMSICIEHTALHMGWEYTSLSISLSCFRIVVDRILFLL